MNDSLLLALAGEGIHAGTSTAQSIGVSGSGQVTSQEVCHPVSVHFCTDTKLRTVLLSVHSLCSQWYTFLRCLATCQLSQEVLVTPFNWKYCKCLQPVHMLTVYPQMMHRQCTVCMIYCMATCTQCTTVLMTINIHMYILKTINSYISQCHCNCIMIINVYKNCYCYTINSRP